MDLTKDIIDFTQKVDYTDLKSSDAKILTHEDFGLFADVENKSQATHDSYEAVDHTEQTVDKLASKMAMECMQKPTTPQLIENAGNVSTLKSTVGGDISPPPRPLTSSEVVGFITTLEDPEMQLDPAVVLNMSRSLPASPNHLKGTHMTDLFTFKPTKPAAIKTTAFIADKKLPGLMKPNGDTLNRTNQQFCLRWNNYQTNLTNVFDELLQNESFVDVTLACEGQSIKAHKMILSACSPYFQALFYDNPCQHPIVIMRDVRWQELKALMEFMYKGEINVSQEQINPLLKVAEMLKIRGLAEVSTSSAGGMASQEFVPEQRMTVFDDEDEEQDCAKTGHDPDDEQEEEEEEDHKTDCTKAKRPRIQISAKNTTALDLKLAEQRLRKRSRDGLLIDNEHRLTAQPIMRSPSPPAQQKYAAVTPPPPLAMTASTIVRNPFASPNPSNQPANANTSANSTSSSSSSSGSGSATSVSSASVAAPYRPRERSTSPSLMLSNARTESLSLTSPASSSTPQISIHPHPAATAAAAAVLANPHHAHHHAAAAAQQFAAQQQLHAAHSHAAMASALGASLAAAAAGSASAGPASSGGSSSHHDDMEIKPEIAEMIREEERAKMIESGHPWMGGASTSSVTDSYQYQLQSMWQKCWNTNQQNLVQQLRFRERGPLKSWRPEAMAEAIFSVLKEGLSLSQAARKYDIPYPTFVLYANRVHNMLGPSLDGGSDPRPKARGRPQRILLGMWPDDLIRSVIKAVVFRDYREIKDEMSGLPFANGQPHAAIFGSSPGGSAVSNGFHNAAKLAAQNSALGQDSASPLSTMTENLRRQIMSQQQQSPISHPMNMYKSPSYVQRSELDDQISGVASKTHADRRGSENLPDLSALGLMGLPGLNVIPSGGGARNSQMPPNAAAYSRERERDRDRERERERRERERERERERDRERQYSNQSRGSAVGESLKSASSASPYSQMKMKDHPNYAYNKRFLDSLPSGIDFEAIANGLLQKSTNKSPRFEDFFPAQDMNDLMAGPESAIAPHFPPQRESNLMKIKLEHQTAELQHED